MAENLNKYLAETYPHVQDDFLVERRNVSDPMWLLHSSEKYWEQNKRTAFVLSCGDRLCRAIDRTRGAIYYPVYDFRAETDREYVPAYWRGIWRDDQRGQLLDVLLEHDKALYPLDRYLPWTFQHLSNDWCWTRKVGDLYSTRIIVYRTTSFQKLVEALTNYYVKEKVDG